MISLDSLNHFNKDRYKPDFMDTMYYLFWEKGISSNEFDELPIPYIMRIMKVHNYVKEQEEKEMKKSRKK